jgi:hypothetical protein
MGEVGHYGNFRGYANHRVPLGERNVYSCPANRRGGSEHTNKNQYGGGLFTVIASEATAAERWASISMPFIVLLLGWMLKRSDSRTAAKVEEVRKTAAETARHADEQSEKILNVSNKVHTLVNSAMGEQLRVTCISARTLANLTGKPEHLQAAEEADVKLAEHERKQSQVDNAEGQQ